LYLTSWEEGAKGPEGNVAGKVKSHILTFEMLRPGIPEKALKCFSVRKGDPHMNKTLKAFVGG
jgi:hypothetical protein